MDFACVRFSADIESHLTNIGARCNERKHITSIDRIEERNCCEISNIPLD